MAETQTNINLQDLLRQEPQAPQGFPKALKKGAQGRDVSERLELMDLFSAINEGRKHTILVMPSLSLDSDLLKDIVGILHYEIRALWHVLHASVPNSKIIFVSSEKVEEIYLKHLLSSFPNPKEIRKRIELICLEDAREKICLTDKVLCRNDIMFRLKELIGDEPKGLWSFLSTSKESELSKELGIPLFGPRPEHEYYLTKSGNRKLFTKAGVPFAKGINDLKTEEDVIEAVIKLWNDNPCSKRFMIKLDYGVSGKGNALLTLPKSYDSFSRLNIIEQKTIILNCLENMKFPVEGSGWDDFHSQLFQGAVVECFIEGKNKTSPSSQAMIYPDGKVEILSTHEQILDESGMVFLGAKFPANRFHRSRLQEWTTKIGNNLASKGVFGYFSVDFLVCKSEQGSVPWVIEINLRQGGTTHPLQTAKWVTGSTYNYKKGILVNPKGQDVYYQSNDNFVLKSLKGKNVEDLINHLESLNLVFKNNSNNGAVLHLMSSMKDLGKIGFTAIANSRKDSIQLAQKVEREIKNWAESAS